MKTMKSYRVFLSLLVLAMVAFIAQNAAGQANRATITGTVTDASGANVQGVEITATNKGTNAPTKAASNQDGIYVIPNLFPGIYSVEFKKDGFDTLVRPSVTLESTEVARIDAALKVGVVSSTVTVTTDAPVLELERPTEGTNMKASVINELPLSIYGGGRFVESFAVDITPGYSIYSSPYGAVINGGQWFTKDYTVDGTSGTGDIPGNSMQNGPSMEAVQELQAQTSGLNAQSSITGGGVITMTLKSGTNKLHGSALLYGANELFDANTWGNTTGKPKRRAWDYAFSVGGPIIKNKTFFFGAFERYTQVDRRLGDYSSFVPTSDFLNGNFSGLLGSQLCTQADTSVAPDCTSAGTTPISVLNNAGQSVLLQEGMIFDPVSGNQFTGNMIDSSRFSSVAQKINAIYQKSYAPQRSGLITPNDRLPLSNSPTQTPNEVVIKLDHELTQRDHLSGSWIYDHKPRTLVDSGGVWEAGSTDGGPLSAARNNFFRSHQYRASEAHTFTSNLLNVLNFTYNYDWQGDEPSASGNWTSQLGFGNTGATNFPIISFDGAQVGDNNSFSETFIGNSFQGDFSGANIITGDTLTWVKGRHSLTFGGDFTAHQVNSHSGSGALAFNFANNTTGAPSQGYAQYVGFGFASYLLGTANTATQTTPYNLYGRQKAMSLFVDDSYKVTRKLTVNMGLRWNYTFRFHEKYGHWANFDLTQVDPTYGVPGRLVFAKNGGDSFEKNEYAANFGPQLGFAYSPWNKLVLRAAFGLIYNPVGVSYFQGTPNGFAPGFKGINQATTPFNWDSGYPGVYQPGSQNVDPTFLFPNVSVDPHALRVGYSDAFNIGAQYELTPDMRVDVSYIGNRGHRLTDTSLAWNEGPTSTFLRLGQQYPDLNGFNHYVCSPADATSYGVTYPYAGFCGPVLSAVAPYPQLAQAESNFWFYPNLLYVGLPRGQSYYDSFVVDFVKRTGRGLTMDLSYTWSRQEGDTYSAQQEGNGYYTAIQDFNNIGVAAHSLTGYDLTHVVKGYVTYELPFGKGRRWMASQNRWVNGVLGGWNMTWLLKYNSGQPFLISAQNPYWPQWGNIYPNYNLSGFKGPNDPRQFPGQTVYMPSSVASQPAVGQLGTGPLAIGSLRCPGAADEDASLLKYFPMGSEGQYRLSFRAEFYNVFNRHYYDIVGCGGSRATIGAGNFGVINGVNSNPRQGQFGFHFEF
ncbi:MAG TPA: carboxypeptidase regulatory-like domain-containing protein [Candidatus Dormibacteraeota bacterium]|nr:carboxypeptidase regulatory-like domain-containing protein [Candidatus Dormibacteraeota bacterium]